MACCKSLIDYYRKKHVLYLKEHVVYVEAACYGQEYTQEQFLILISKDEDSATLKDLTVTLTNTKNVRQSYSVTINDMIFNDMRKTQKILCKNEELGDRIIDLLTEEESDTSRTIKLKRMEDDSYQLSFCVMNPFKDVELMYLMLHPVDAAETIEYLENKLQCVTDKMKEMDLNKTRKIAKLYVEGQTHQIKLNELSRQFENMERRLNEALHHKQNVNCDLRSSLSRERNENEKLHSELDKMSKLLKRKDAEIYQRGHDLSLLKIRFNKLNEDITYINGKYKKLQDDCSYIYNDMVRHHSYLSKVQAMLDSSTNEKSMLKDTIVTCMDFISSMQEMHVYVQEFLESEGSFSKVQKQNEQTQRMMVELQAHLDKLRLESD